QATVIEAQIQAPTQIGITDRGTAHTAQHAAAREGVAVLSFGVHQTRTGSPLQREQVKRRAQPQIPNHPRGRRQDLAPAGLLPSKERSGSLIQVEPVLRCRLPNACAQALSQELLMETQKVLLRPGLGRRYRLV